MIGRGIMTIEEASLHINVVEELEKRFLLQEEYLGNSKPVNKIQPFVSVCVTTYQQALYIRDCLEGILMQKTEFPYEVIVGEDGSTDGTREICKAYAEKHTDKIRLFLRDRNISHCKLESGAVRFNGIFTRMTARGKYTAICEGDDYWIDPNKLNKQIDYLEKNEYCSVCFHNAFIIDEGSANRVGSFNIPDNTRIFTTRELFNNWFVPTASIVYRTDALPSKYSEWYLRAHNGDLALLFLLSKQGNLGVIPGYLSVYRHNAVNSLSLTVKENSDHYISRLIDLIKAVNLYFDGKYEEEAKRMCLTLERAISDKKKTILERRIVSVYRAFRDRFPRIIKQMSYHRR